jgi:hypothetical protein
MQDPNEDTEWNDVLRAKGILPPKEKKDITEEDIVNMLEQTIQQKTGGTKRDCDARIWYLIYFDYIYIGTVRYLYNQCYRALSTGIL